MHYTNTHAHFHTHPHMLQAAAAEAAQLPQRESQKIDCAIWCQNNSPPRNRRNRNQERVLSSWGAVRKFVMGVLSQHLQGHGSFVLIWKRWQRGKDKGFHNEAPPTLPWLNRASSVDWASVWEIPVEARNVILKYNLSYIQVGLQ